MNLSLRSLSRRVPVVAATGAIVLLPAVADAAFPGANGSIVYRSTQQATASGCPAYTASELFTVLPAGQLDCTGYTDRHAFVSPDRSQVIFASNRDVGSTSSDQLYLMPLSTVTPLGTPPGVSQNLPSGASDDYPS